MRILPKEPIVTSRDGESIVYGINQGEYPSHQFINNPLATSQDITSMAMTLARAGNDKWVKGCMRHRVKSNLTSLELIVEGEMKYETSRGTYRIKPGSLFIVHHGEDSKMTAESEFLHKKTIILPGFVSDQIVATLGLAEVDVIDVSDQHDLANQFDQIFKELAKQKSGFSIRASQYTFGILLQMSQKQLTANYPPLLTKVLEFIYVNIDKKLALNDICKYAGTSAGSLNNLFNQYFKLSPIEFVLQHKIKVAKQLLLNRHRYIKEIAAEVGFSSQYYFTLVFKKRTGMSPTEFRQSNL